MTHDVIVDGERFVVRWLDCPTLFVRDDDGVRESQCFVDLESREITIPLCHKRLKSKRLSAAMNAIVNRHRGRRSRSA